MKKIEWILNMVYYQVFRWEKFTQNFFNYPFRRFINKNEKVEKALFDEKTGFTSIMAGLIMSSSIALFLVFLVLTVCSFLQIGLNKIVFAIIIMVPSYIIYNTLVERKYVDYFDDFKCLPRITKAKWGLLAFLYFIVMISLAILGFWLMIENGGNII